MQRYADASICMDHKPLEDTFCIIIYDNGLPQQPLLSCNKLNFAKCKFVSALIRKVRLSLIFTPGVKKTLKALYKYVLPTTIMGMSSIPWFSTYDIALRT